MFSPSMPPLLSDKPAFPHGGHQVGMEEWPKGSPEELIHAAYAVDAVESCECYRARMS